MGNQHSRLDHRSASTVGHFDTISKTITPWQDTDAKQDPYKRHYLLPTISATSSDGRIKIRKQSSPSPVTTTTTTNATLNTNTASSSSNHSKRAFARLLPFRAFSRDNISASTLCETPSPLSVALQAPSSVHPLTSITSLPHVLTTGDDQVSLCSTHQPRRESWSSCKHSKNNNNNNNNNNRKSQFNTFDSPETCLWIAGRKFHQTLGSSYLLPCDEEEIDRLHLQHFMVRFAIQGNYLAPVSDILRKGARVLDVGCGPGSWTMEIAGEYPKSTVVGVDINNMFPRDIKPSNCEFYNCNILHGLPFNSGSFDYVFMRGVALGVEESKWAPLIAELVRVLKPGGWIELVEADSKMHRVGPITQEYNQHLLDLMASCQMDPRAGQRLKEKLVDHGGLMNTTTKFISCPGGQWAGKLGQLTLQSWKAYYQALRPQICLAGKATAENYESRLQACWREADEYKTFENVHFAYAQKKYSSSSSSSSSTASINSRYSEND
ncbi:hypothetical protein J3Q64DRAFT_1701745 [Phycomyces blakesleeanus]|uniref:Methyltransferase domain-containing protein n=2 Tax=Phycomyces blakesleeanus TaxID=4837 RepID=A0A162N2E8_PHYB8|nr:hypothetical protein PHYBLDRAFT_68171 [Phycomyces blakesleeanus NRRL 1555(-)]OAD67798.1 hypothetical protein PHYBLDRAFT_68171 [Phycomyces blakesleeanus NRRL 1555(-)]|eukprot:XP_018285838.1 hypothetical protein PHYBLDRAFT_68171 [Phycomyces blakesleeanus NRRL 1555(-)]